MTSEEARRVVGVIFEGDDDCICGAIERLMVAFPEHRHLVFDMWSANLDIRESNLPLEYRDSERREMRWSLEESGLSIKST